jgi:geranylgeranyl diphosphate synthase type I
MRVELIAGQYLDVFEQARGTQSVAQALNIARYKSAKYTIERPLHIGAAIAGAEPAVFAAYSGYGLPLGEAFQLRDDILGVFGDPSETGKPAGDDLREGKRTVMIALALEKASGAQAAQVDRLLGDPALDTAGITELQTIIEETGALANTEQMIGDLLELALASLTTVELEPEAVTILTGLAHAATRRRV